jgi:TolA-binding protein
MRIDRRRRRCSRRPSSGRVPKGSRARRFAVLALAAVALLLARPDLAAAQLFGGEEERQRLSGAPDPAAVAPVSPTAEPRAPSPAPAVQPPPAPTVVPTPASAVAAEPAAGPRPASRTATESDLDELSAALVDFEQQAREYRNDVKLIIDRTYEQRRDELGEKFERSIREYEGGEREERLAAIALFERFVARYPSDEKFTPDAMTRLAELYFEKNEDDNQRALADYQERLAMGASDEPPPEPIKKYDKPIELYQRVLSGFPNYRLSDAVQYLLAFCLGEQDEPERALEEYRLLISKYPTSKYVPEAWVRVGEYYFDYSGPDINEKLREGVKAYSNAIRYPDGPMYDKALYKLGWSYYRLDDFDRAVDVFIALVDYYERLKAAGKDSGGDLRAEALQYTAISFTDEKWVGSAGEDSDRRLLSVPKLVAYFARIGPRVYEDELYRKLGDMLFDSTKYKESVEAYRVVLQKNPLAPDAPKIQERIVTAFARDQDKASAFAEREKLVRDYGERSAWAKANKNEQDVLKVARDLVEKALLATAQYHHAQASEYDKGASDESRSAEDRAQMGLKAIAEYREAAKAYGEYLAEFPHSKNIYEIQYYHAETLFSSGQFAAAAAEYARVRDSNTDNKYLANAAYYVVLALQREIDQQEMQGMLEKREPCDPKRCEGIEIKPLPIADIRLRLIEAADTYLNKIPTAEDAPILSYKAGQTYFTYFQFDEARARYEDVIKRFPDKEVADYAYEDILITYLLVSDWVKVEAFADRQLRESKAVRNDPVKYEAKRLLKYGARFKRANLLMEAKKWEEASKLYVSIVDDTEREAKSSGRKWDNADKALFNAATCFVEARRFDSAMRTYERLFTDYPDSSLAQDALFYVAANAEKAFDFEKAITTYLKLVNSPKYKDSPKRVAALFNAGQLLEALQRYDEAAETYQRYAREFPGESDAPAQAYQAAVIFQRMKSWSKLIGGLNNFIAQFKDVKKYPGESERIVQAKLKIALAQRELKDEKAAQAGFAEVLREYSARGMTKDNYLAAQSAGEARFWIVQAEFDVFKAKPFDPKGRGAKLAKDTQDKLKALAEMLELVKGHFREVFGFGPAAAEWVLAALYRIGECDELFAQKLLESPCPAEVRAEFGEEGCTESRIALEELVQPILDRSATAYELAQDRAEELRISNKWTKQTNEKVCQNSPAKCKSLKDPLAKLISDELSPRPLVEPDGATPIRLRAAPPPAPAAPAPAAPETAPTGIGAPSAIAPVSGAESPAAPAAVAEPAVVPAPAPPAAESSTGGAP